MAARSAVQSQTEILDCEYKENNNVKGITYAVKTPFTVTPESIRRYTQSNATEISGIGKFELGNYTFYHVLLLKNNCDRQQEYILKNNHPIQEVYRINNGSTRLSFTPTYGAKDPNGLITIKTRNAVTFSLSAFTQDTMVYVTKIIEAGESAKLYLANASYFQLKSLKQSQYISLFNGVFLGVLITFLLSTFYFYIRIREKYLLYYIIYLLIFLTYYWRDLEFWNENFDFTHSYLSWLDTKGLITFFIFLFYLLFIHSILETDQNSIIKKFSYYTIRITPVLVIIDFALNLWYPYYSIAFTYTFGVVVGCLQLYLLYPLWKEKGKEKTHLFLIWGSVCIFLGWLSILLLDVSIHVYTVRIFTIFELVFFMLAIVERFLKVRNELLLADIRKKEAIAQERDRIAAELHDDIGATLTGIAMYSHLATDQLKSKSENQLVHTLEIIQTNIRDAIVKIQDIIWLNNSESYTLQDALYRLQEYGEKMAAVKNIRVDFKIEISTKNLPINTIKNIYLIFKEGMINAVKHADCSHIHFNAHEANTSLYFELTDNGTWPANVPYDGTGIKNMKKRATHIGSRLHLLSQEMKGTTIRLELKPTV